MRPRSPSTSTVAQRSLFEDPVQAEDELPAAIAGPARPAPGASAPLVVTEPGAETGAVAPGPGFDNFHHPRAAHVIELEGRQVGYEFRRARRRSIGFVVATEGLRVSAPRWVALRDVENALREKAGWIVSKLLEQQVRAARIHAARPEWRDGTTLSYMGAPLTLLLDPARRGSALVEAADGTRSLRLGLAHDAPPERIAHAVQAWLKAEARRLFEARCAHYAALMGVRFTRLALSSARTRWGSASSNGSIRLHWRLVHFALPTIDYVVVHELAHLREMNHSARFWGIVRGVLPEFELARGALKAQVLPAFD